MLAFDWVKEDLLDIQGYTIGGECYPSLKLLGDLSLDILAWHHDVSGIHRNGMIDRLWWDCAVGSRSYEPGGIVATGSRGISLAGVSVGYGGGISGGNPVT